MSFLFGLVVRCVFLLIFISAITIFSIFTHVGWSGEDIKLLTVNASPVLWNSLLTW